jgi:HEAT repeat protein
MTSERVAEEVVDDGATPAVDRIPAGDRRSVPALRAALADKAYATRSAAAKHLGRLGDAATAALPDLARALQDPAGTVRVSAALAHWRISTHPERAVECLRDVLRRGGMALRIEAAWALGAMGSAAAPAVPELTSLVEGHLARTGTPLGYGDGKMVVEPGYLDTTARSAAADALAALGDRSRHVRAALERLGASGTRCEREAASQALAALGGR